MLVLGSYAACLDLGKLKEKNALQKIYEKYNLRKLLHGTSLLL